jgi:hypothetical protein
MQTLNKAIVIGQNSAGGAHPTKSYVIKEFSIVFDIPVHNSEAFERAIELARIQIRNSDIIL